MVQELETHDKLQEKHFRSRTLAAKTRHRIFTFRLQLRCGGKEKSIQRKSQTDARKSRQKGEQQSTPKTDVFALHTGAESARNF